MILPKQFDHLKWLSKYNQHNPWTLHVTRYMTYDRRAYRNSKNISSTALILILYHLHAVFGHAVKMALVRINGRGDAEFGAPPFGMQLPIGFGQFIRLTIRGTGFTESAEVGTAGVDPFSRTPGKGIDIVTCGDHRYSGRTEDLK